jgi:signal transduction histidine kinase/PAS domain-containing protein/ActR/RegA family two-component response regulator
LNLRPVRQSEFRAAVGRVGYPITLLAIWLPSALVAGALLSSGNDDYPALHVALDMAMALLAAVLAWLLWDVGSRVDWRLPRLLAITFSFGALLNLFHVLVAVEWSGPLEFLAHQAANWRPATWPPGTHLLSVGTLASLLLADRRRPSTVAFAFGAAAFAVLLLVLFKQAPRYVPPGFMGITRPNLLVVPVIWALVAGIAVHNRKRDRLMLPLAFMAITLCVANVTMLYSRAPHDAMAMIAHLGRVSGYLLMLLALMRGATLDMQARIDAERALAQANAQLETRVRERTAELVRSTESLQQSELRFRAFVSATSDVVYRMSPDWSEMRQLLGQDFIADTTEPDSEWLSKYIHPDDQGLVTSTIREAIRAKDVFELEHRVVQVDGTLGWTFSRAVPLLDKRGEIIEWFGAASDVTARRQAEDKSRAQLARLSLLGDITRAISDRLDPQSIFQVVLRTLETELPLDFACICRLATGESILTVACVGIRSASLALELALPERTQVEIDQNGLSRCLQGHLVHEPDISQSNDPFTARLAGGGLRSLVFAPLNADGKVFGVLVAARRRAASFASVDCEFLRQLSEHLSLAAHQAQLHAALQEAYEDLRESQQAVLQQERLRALGQLASGIAHDINNALTPAALYTQSLLERDATLSAETRERLTIINRAIEDVGGTVGRMRMFYRPRDSELTLVPLDFNETARQVIELTRARWKDMPQEHGFVVELATELEARMPVVMGAETEIRDALTNLVLNAVDAMPDGGTLTLRTRTRDRLAIIEVSDTGLGMSDVVRARCLEPFYTTKGERGTGLGLAMVYGMVQRHSADLEIDSAPGRGTTVRLAFHVTDTAAEPSVHVPQLPAEPMRLLLVDDDPVLLQSLQFVLAADGHLVTTADGGQAGIIEFKAAQSRGEPYALVVTDLGMPKLDGRSVAAAIKNASSTTPVVLLTGWGQRLQDDRELPTHVDAVLSKPPKISELRATLARLVSNGDIPRFLANGDSPH